MKTCRLPLAFGGLLLPTHRVKPLGAAEDAQHDLVQSRIGPEKIPTLDRAAGDVDEGTFFGDEAEWS